MEEKKTAVSSGWDAARVGRFICFVATMGFAFPNVMVEDMDLTAMQKTTQGSLYD